MWNKQVAQYDKIGDIESPWPGIAVPPGSAHLPFRGYKL